jgi:hypothetical protein
MSSRTIFLARLFGLYCLLAGVSMAIRKPSIIETVTALVHNAPLMFFIGVVTLFGGLAMVLGHNVWSGGGLAVVVTLLGWITLLKGLLFLFVPPASEANLLLGTMHYEKLFYFYLSITLIAGIYLTYAGFASRART